MADDASYEDEASPRSGDEMDEEDLGLTENQQRLLYLISLYSSPAASADEQEHWIKHTALMVLVYEGVVAQVFDYDYAPASEVVEGQRMFFNVSQEGKSDLEYLREEELVNGAKLATKLRLPSTLYQISTKGLRALRAIDDYDKHAVNSVAYSPAQQIMEVEFDGEDFWLAATSADGSKDGYRKRSTVLAVEEVSYVSSAYIPACLRHGGRPTLSNAHRARECTQVAAGTIRDDLDEVLSLNSVSVIVGEYIPFGSNQMVQLNHTLGSPERVLGGFYTAAVEDDAGTSTFQMDPGLTAIQILDYSLAGHINLEADIRLPEPDGIVQVETFGCSLNANGACFFGLQLEAVMDRIKDAISLDHLARLLVDVQTDSSEIVEPLLSPDQRRVLDLVYRGDAPNRNKVNMIVANEITPHLTAEEYMDKGEYETELKQVLGDTRAAYDVSQDDTLIFGGNGLLLVGPNSRSYEPLLVAYVQLLSMDLFAQNMFNIMAVVSDDIRSTGSLCRDSRRDPTQLQEAVQKLPMIGRRVLVLEKVTSFMEESLLSMSVPEPPLTAAGRSLYDRLACPQLQAEMARRVTDFGKFLAEMRRELDIMENMASQIQREREGETTGVVERQNREMIKTMRDPRWGRGVNSLETMSYILSGLLGFAFMDRITGDWSVAQSGWLSSFNESVIEGAALVWFLVSLIFFFGALFLIRRWHLLASKREDQDIVTIHLELRRAMSTSALTTFLEPKEIISHNWEVTPDGDEVAVTWLEETDYQVEWGGAKPRITLRYSMHLSRALSLDIFYIRGQARDDIARMKHEDVREKVMNILESEGVLLSDPSAPTLVMGRIEESERLAQLRKAARRGSLANLMDDGFKNQRIGRPDGARDDGASVESEHEPARGNDDGVGASSVAVRVAADQARTPFGGQGNGEGVEEEPAPQRRPAPAAGSRLPDGNGAVSTSATTHPATLHAARGEREDDGGAVLLAAQADGADADDEPAGEEPAA